MTFYKHSDGFHDKVSLNSNGMTQEDVSKHAELLRRTAKSANERQHVSLENASVALFRIVINVRLLLMVLL